MRNAATIAALCLGTVLGGRADAEMYGGIEFPSGAASFADEVMAYDDDFLGFGNPPTDPKFNHPDRALGIPDYSGGPDGTGAVALGQGGLLELLFTDNVVTNSGDSVVDLVVFDL